jgi:hypothetical protein
MTTLLPAALWAVLCLLAVSASGATLPVTPNQGTSAIQNILSSAKPGDTILFSAGTYNITNLLNVPCGTTISGPTASPTTAVLAASYTGNNIFSIVNCSLPTTIEYLHFENTGGIYVTAPSSTLTITHNQFTNLPANYSQWTDMGIYFDGTSGGTIADAVISSNVFGDPASCTAVMSVNTDEGGDCDGLVFQGNLQGIVVESNEFTHLEEGFHVLCYGNNCSGPTAPNWSHFIAQWNDFNNIHRIAMEMQPEDAADVIIQYNSYENAFAPSTFSMGISAACCAGTTGATAPFVNNNVLLANIPPAGDYIAYGIEFWGNGAQASENLIQGYWANGIVWGKGGPPWEIVNNAIEGPNMGASYDCYVCDEKEGAASPPLLGGNLSSATISPVVSVAPVITQSSGTVAISDAGANTSIYYTIDGSTPTTASTLYAGPFTPPPGSTVSAIGMWGQGANPSSYPTGYGYVPSAVVSSVIAGSSGAPTLQSLSLTGASSVAIGSAPSQLTAVATYSDGSQEPVIPTKWSSSQTAICIVSATGFVSPVAPGACAITATYGSVVSAAYSITVEVALPTLTSVTISANATAATVGATVQFTSLGVYSNGTTAPITPTWSTSNSVVASISANGLLTALQPGSVQVSALFGGIKSAAAVSINIRNDGPIAAGYLGAPGNTTTLAPCGTLQFTAYAVYSDGTIATVTPSAWSTSNSSVGTISPAGLFTALAPGAVSVSAQLTASVTSTVWNLTIAPASPVTIPLGPGTYTIVVAPCGAASIAGTGVTVSQ